MDSATTKEIAALSAATADAISAYRKARGKPKRPEDIIALWQRYAAYAHKKMRAYAEQGDAIMVGIWMRESRAASKEAVRFLCGDA